MKFSIVIPAKDEEKRIPATLAQLCRYIQKNKHSLNLDAEVIVVVNNTTDETYNIVKIFQKHFPFIRVYNIKEAIGKGGAIKFGFEKAIGDYIGYMDADGSMNPINYFKLFEELVMSGAEIGISDRYSSNSTIIGHVPLNRKFYSLGFRLLNKVLFGLKYPDTQCGYKIFKQGIGKYLMANNQVTGWTFDVNILLMAKFLGIEILSIPTIWEYKEDSKLNVLKALRSVPLELIELFVKYNIGRVGQLLKGLPYLKQS